jgi:hypothetical protein
MCLTVDPDKRPTAAEALKHKVHLLSVIASGGVERLLYPTVAIGREAPLCSRSGEPNWRTNEFIATYTK